MGLYLVKCTQELDYLVIDLDIPFWDDVGVSCTENPSTLSRERFRIIIGLHHCFLNLLTVFQK
jgi:hypothetical protein